MDKRQCLEKHLEEAQAKIDELEYRHDNMLLLIEALRIGVLKFSQDMTEEDRQRFMDSCVREVYEMFDLKD